MSHDQLYLKIHLNLTPTLLTQKHFSHANSDMLIMLKLLAAAFLLPCCLMSWMKLEVETVLCIKLKMTFACG